MRVQYNPKHFLRQIPKRLLKEFFDRRKELTDLSWDELAEMNVDPVFEDWMRLPEPSRADVERSFRSVSDLATPEGLQTLIEEGQFHRVDLHITLDERTGLHEKAFWVYLAVELKVNRKRIQRLMRILGIEAHYRKPNLSRPAPGTALNFG